jgi:spore maturation protein CgeB
MKILFVGAFNNDWSANYPRAWGLKNNNHRVICFDTRYRVSKSRKESSESNPYKKKILRKYVYDGFYEKLVKKIRRKKHISFFNKILNINDYYLTNWKLNRQLFSEVKKNKYNLVFLAKVSNIHYKLIPKLNKYSKTLYLMMDSLYLAERVNALKYASLSTFAWANKGTVNLYFKKNGIDSFLVTEGVNTTIFNPGQGNTKKEIDVVFVGSFTPQRYKYISFLIKNGINVECFGMGWKNNPIFLEDLAEKYRKSKIVLNFNRGDSGFSDRVFLVMASGSLMVSEYSRDLERTFKKEIHLEWFKTSKEMLQIVRYYLKNDNESQKIAQCGNKFVLNNFTWDQKMKEVLKHVSIHS